MRPEQYAADITRGLAELRLYAQARMTSRCTIRRQSGDDPQNEDTGIEAPEWVDVYADRPMRYVGGSSRRIDIAGVEFQEGTGRADFPHGTHDLRDGDLIEITAGEWEGTVLRIVEAVKGDQRTARRVPVVEVDRPGEWD